MEAPSRTVGYVLASLAVTVLISVVGRRRVRAEAATFDAGDEHAVTQLTLSERQLVGHER